MTFDEALHVRFPRLVAAAVAAERALDRIDDLAETREELERLVELDRRSRDAIGEVLNDLDLGSDPVAVVLADGTIVFRTIESDGLGIVPPSRVIRIPAASARETPA